MITREVLENELNKKGINYKIKEQDNYYVVTSTDCEYTGFDLKELLFSLLKESEVK